MVDYNLIYKFKKKFDQKNTLFDQKNALFDQKNALFDQTTLKEFISF